MNNKSFYLWIKGQKVDVSEEVYRAYVRPIRKEQTRKRREKKCQIRGPKGNLIRCTSNCSTCKYELDGKRESGELLSLETFKEEGFELEDRNSNTEENFIEQETKIEIQQKMRKAISFLNPEQQKIVKLLYFEEKSQVEIAKLLGIKPQSLTDRLKVILKTLKKILKDFES